MMCSKPRAVDRRPMARLMHISPVMLMIVLIVLLLLSVAGGGWGHSRYGYAGWSPAGLLLLVLAIFWLTGNLHY